MGGVETGGQNPGNARGRHLARCFGQKGGCGGRNGARAGYVCRQEHLAPAVEQRGRGQGAAGKKVLELAAHQRGLAAQAGLAVQFVGIGSEGQIVLVRAGLGHAQQSRRVVAVGVGLGGEQAHHVAVGQGCGLIVQSAVPHREPGGLGASPGRQRLFQVGPYGFVRRTQDEAGHARHRRDDRQHKQQHEPQGAARGASDGSGRSGGWSRVGHGISRLRSRGPSAREARSAGP